MNKSVILYSTGCPQCRILERKLDQAGVVYDVINDVDEMLKLGLKSAPALSVDGEIMEFKNAIKWVADAVSLDVTRRDPNTNPAIPLYWERW